MFVPAAVKATLWLPDAPVFSVLFCRAQTWPSWSVAGLAAVIVVVPENVLLPERLTAVVPFD